MSHSCQRSLLHRSKWLILALAIIATPTLAHAGGATRIVSGGNLYAIGANGNIYRGTFSASPWVNLGTPYPNTPAIDIAVGSSYIYVLAWSYSTGYLLWRCSDLVTGLSCDWTYYYNTPTNKQYGVRLAVQLGGMGEDLPVIATASTRTYRWQNSNWVEVPNAIASYVSAKYQPLEGNFYFVSPQGRAYRWNGASASPPFTALGLSRTGWAKEISYPGANFPNSSLILGSDGVLYRWDNVTNTQKYHYPYYPIQDFAQDGYGYPFILYGACSGGGYKVGYMTTPTSGIYYIGPNGGCLY